MTDILYRQHRCWLDDSLETTRPVKSVADIAAIEECVAKSGIDLSSITIEPYGFDARIGWDTHLVSVPGYGVLGFTNGPL